MTEFMIPPIGTNTDSALEFAERVRAAMVAVKEAIEVEVVDHRLEKRIMFGLSVGAYASQDAAAVVAADLRKTLLAIYLSADQGASAAKLFADKLQAFYIEPILESQNRPKRRDGLQVNGV